jgi:hypothetical protein
MKNARLMAIQEEAQGTLRQDNYEIVPEDNSANRYNGSPF